MTAPVDLVQQVADLRARHSELCELMEQRRGGSEAHGEIQSIDRKLADLAPVLAAEVARLRERVGIIVPAVEKWAEVVNKYRENYASTSGDVDAADTELLAALAKVRP